MLGPNMMQMTAGLQHLPDQQLLQMMHNPSASMPQFALIMEMQRRQQLRNGAQAQQAQQQQQLQKAQQAQQQLSQQANQGTQNTLAQGQMDKMTGGIGKLPAPNMAMMAEGGIVGFAEGGLSDDDAPPLENLVYANGTAYYAAHPNPVTAKPTLDDTNRKGAGSVAARYVENSLTPNPQSHSQTTFNAGIKSLQADPGKNLLEQMGPPESAMNKPATSQAPQPELDIFGFPKNAFANYRSPFPNNSAEDTMQESLRRSDDAYRNAKGIGLLSAGLGMMSGTSPFALSNIGKGGLEGVQAYQGALGADQQARAHAAQTQMEGYKSNVGYNSAIDTAQIHNIGQMYLMNNSKFLALDQQARQQISQDVAKAAEMAINTARLDQTFGTKPPMVQQAEINSYMQSYIDKALAAYNSSGYGHASLGQPTAPSQGAVPPPGAQILPAKP